MPTASEIREFYDGYLDRLNKPTTRHQFICQTFNTIILKNSKVLDIGCGTGITSKHLATRAKEVVAVDISPVLVEYAIKHNTRPNLTYLTADITELVYPEKFDFISIVDVFEHIPTDRIPYFMDAIKKFSHDRTQIYLNIPTWDVLKYLTKYNPEILQIVDVPHEDPAKYFRQIGFIPAYSKLYWTHYMEYIFYPEVLLKNVFDSIFKPVKRSASNG